MRTKGNIITFDTDDEFTDYCMSCAAEISPCEVDGRTYYVHDYPFNKAYLDAVDAGMRFIIKEKNSKVMKRGAVCRGLITKQIDNLGM